MSAATPEPVVNLLIESLPRKQRNRVLERCEIVDLVFDTILCDPYQPYRHVYFPLTGFISLVKTSPDQQPLGMGLIGNEGMLGVTLILDVDTAMLRAEVQGEGAALRMTAVEFQHECRSNPAWLNILSRYLYLSMQQFTGTAACAHFHTVEARLAYWLLMTHDRAHANHFNVTHEFLANKLGVRRSGITVAAGELQKRKLIHYSRGKISILDRKGLVARSCVCYNEASEDDALLLN